MTVSYNRTFNSSDTENPYDNFLVLVTLHLLSCAPSNMKAKTWMANVLKMSKENIKLITEEKRLGSLHTTIFYMNAVGYAPLIWTENGVIKFRFIKGMRHILTADHIESKFNEFLLNFLKKNAFEYIQFAKNAGVNEVCHPFIDTGVGVKPKLDRFMKFGFPVTVTSDKVSVTLSVGTP